MTAQKKFRYHLAEYLAVHLNGMDDWQFDTNDVLEALNAFEKGAFDGNHYSISITEFLGDIR